MHMTTNTLITKERVKAWSACSDGYKWFLDNYNPAEAEFSPVYQHLIKDKRPDDADWLMGKLFDELDTDTRVKLVVQIAGADAKLIAEQQSAGAQGITSADEANAATTGYRANAATTGESANAATTGESANAATTGKHAVAAALGIASKAKASEGGAIVLVHRNDDGELLAIRASKVGENGIEPDVWYELNESGEFLEVA